MSAAASAKAQGFPKFRIYGNDCGTTFDYATNAAKVNGMKVLIGIYASTSPSYRTLPNN